MPKMVLTVQIYDPRGELTFKLTTKSPPVSKPAGGVVGGGPSFTFGSSASPAPFGGETAAAASIADPVLTRGLFGATPSTTYFPYWSTTTGSPARQYTTGLFGKQPAPTSKPDEEVKVEEVEMLVSSSQMRLVSPVFNARFEHKFMEGEALREHGKVVIPLPDDESVAFAILMQIIHAQNNLVPKQIDLQTLTSIAILVDKYRLHGCTSVFVSIWIDSLRPSILRISSSQGKDIVRWLCITCVFDRHVEFTMVTLVAQQHLRAPTLKMVYGQGFEDLPIPDKVIARVEERREKPIHDALNRLQELVDKLLEPTGGAAGTPFGTPIPPLRCPRGDEKCESMLLGSLLRSIKAQYLWPILRVSERIFIDTMTLTQKLRGLQVHSQCGNNFGSKNLTHGVAEAISGLVTSLEASHQGLNLKDFQENKKERNH